MTDFIHTLHRCFQSSPNCYCLACARIAFAVVASIMVYTNLEQISLVWYGASDSTLRWVQAGHIVWLVILTAFGLGLGGRWPSIGSFLCGVLLHDLKPLGSSLDLYLFQITGFWMMFMRLDQCWALGCCFRSEQKKKRTSGWPIFLLGVNWGVLFLLAGLAKWVDPLWRNGLALYYVFLIPWIKFPTFDFLLNYEWLMRVGTYGSIFFEVTFLGFFVFPKTRRFALVMAGLFFALLSYPFQIHFVGPFGLVLVLFLWSITFTQSAEGEDCDSVVLPAICGAHILFHAMVQVLLQLDQFHYPMVKSPLTLGPPSVNIVSDNRSVSSPSLGWKEASIAEKVSIIGSLFRNRNFSLLKEKSIARLRGLYQNYLYPFSYYTIKVSIISPFNSYHIFGTYAYKAVVKLDDGTNLEPVEVFKEDKSAGLWTRGWSPRWPQQRMYDLRMLCHRLAQDPDAVLPPEEIDNLRRIIQFTLDMVPPDIKPQTNCVSLFVSPIDLPSEFQGDVKPWVKSEWYELYRFDMSDRTWQGPFSPPPFNLEVTMPGLETLRIADLSSSV